MSDGQNPFILIARITVKNGKIEEYLKIADEADKAVYTSEPGMIFHNFDSDPSDATNLFGARCIGKAVIFFFMQTILLHKNIYKNMMN